jgi:membrane protein
LTDAREHPGDVPPSRAARARAWAEARRADAQRLEERAQHERTRHRSLDAVFDMVDRDGEVGGGIIAGALAYRLFIWLLPLALVAVAGLGIAAEAASESPHDAATKIGLEGFVSSSISNAAKSPNRWYALLAGIPLLVWATRSVLRVLIGAHRLVWTDVRARAPRPTPVASMRLLLLLLCFPIVSDVAAAVRESSPGVGVVANLVALVPFAGLWLLVSVRLPHLDAPWQALVPGALAFAIGLELFHVVSVYFIAPYAEAKQGTYGALGAAAALLVGLFLISRLVVVAAILNATLWERRATRVPRARAGEARPSGRDDWP